MAEDVAQESFIAAIRSLPRFDRRRRFGPWLHRIVTNRAIDALRERDRRGRLIADAYQVASAAEVAGAPELSPELAAALDRLSATDRAIVVLRHLFDYRSHEIAAMLRMPAGTVRRRLAAGLADLRSELEESR